MEECEKREGPRPKLHCFCWPSEMQHMVTNHRDLECCWCGKVKCFDLKEIAVEGHGPFRTASVIDE